MLKIFCRRLWQQVRKNPLLFRKWQPSVWTLRNCRCTYKAFRQGEGHSFTTLCFIAQQAAFKLPSIKVILDQQAVHLNFGRQLAICPTDLSGKSLIRPSWNWSHASPPTLALVFNAPAVQRQLCAVQSEGCHFRKEQQICFHLLSQVPTKEIQHQGLLVCYRFVWKLFLDGNK